MTFSVDPGILGLIDNVALVVGGGGAGMGRAHCLQLARAGCHIVVADIDEEAGQETVRQVDALGRRAVFVTTNALAEPEVQAAIDLALSTFGRLDVGVNHVGGAVGRGPFLDYDEGDWDDTIALCLKTTFYCCRHEAMAMIAEGIDGRIVNVGSTAGVAAAEANSAYGAGKAAVIHLTKSLAVELAKFGIRVNSILPGFHETAYGGGSREVGQQETPSMVWSLDANAKAPPMRRLGNATETAGLTVFFASRLSQFVTGHSLASDGGLLLTINRPQTDKTPAAVREIGREPLFE